MSSLDLIQLPYCHESDRYDTKFVIALIAAVATGAFFCRPRITDIRFYSDSDPVPEPAEPESHLEPITSREKYLKDALDMAYQHRSILEEEVRMLEGWVDHFQQNPLPYPVEDTVSDLDKAINQVLEQHREDGVTAKEILDVLKDYFENLTKSEINQRLYTMNKENKVRFFTDNKKAPVWRL